MTQRSDSFVPLTDARPDDVPWAPLAWPIDAGRRLTGSWVELLPLDPDDDPDGLVGALFDALDHEEVWRHLSGRPGSREEYAEELRRTVATGRLPWAVRLRHDFAGLPGGSVVGTTSYLDVSVPDARLEIGSTAYTPAVWGTAVNPDTKLVLFAHCFDELGAGRVQLKTDVRNHRSQRAIDALGATYEGTLRRYQRRSDGTVRDTVMFSVLAEEWPAVRERLQGRLAAFPAPSA